MLRLLSGRTHRVHTGRRRAPSATSIVADVGTHVRDVARRSPTTLIEWYVGTGEPLGKAGAYAIQGAGGVFVDGVHGSVTNVIGLPLALLDRADGRRGVVTRRSRRATPASR